MPLKPAFKIPTIMLCALAIGFSAAPYAMAEEVDNTPPPSVQNDILPVKSAADTDIVIDDSIATHPALNLTPDRSELVRLDRKASAVIVGNPAHLSILPEGSDILVLVPKAPGATYFTVLDENNQVIMQRHVIVAAPKEHYVRIRKACGGSADCQATQVYYCPDMCHEIILNGSGSGKSSGQSASKSASVSQDSVAEPASEAAPATEETDNSGSDEEPTTEE